MYYLDIDTPMINFQRILNDDIYVDKSLLIEKTNHMIGKRNIEREDKSGKGYVDYLFTPINKQYSPIILELKFTKSAKDAIDQIFERHYIGKVKAYQEVLLVGINYDLGSKHHECMIETYKNITKNTD